MKHCFKPNKIQIDKCWVGEGQKNIYRSREEAKVAAKVAEYDHGIKLGIYKCEYGEHWHLTSL